MVKGNESSSECVSETIALCLAAALTEFSYMLLGEYGCCIVNHSYHGTEYDAWAMVMVRVRRQTQTPDGLTAYKVRVKRFLKASDKVQLILTKGLIYTIPGTCAVSLQPRSTYVITGNVEAGKPWTNLCHFTKPWATLSPKMKKGFRLLYQSGCDCPIMSCHYWERCPQASFMCSWETSNEIDDCQGRHAVCLRSANGTCGWLGGRLYRACMKRRRARGSNIRYTNDITEDNESVISYKSEGNDRHLARSDNDSTDKQRVSKINESIKRNHNKRIRKPSRVGYGHAFHRGRSHNPSLVSTRRKPIGYVQKEHLI
ncbi:unnamed protein product, partial [Meganyctiphanes norvegica]